MVRTSCASVAATLTVRRGGVGHTAPPPTLLFQGRGGVELQALSGARRRGLGTSAASIGVFRPGWPWRWRYFRHYQIYETQIQKMPKIRRIKGLESL
jgi:hypothetical protein